MSDETEVRVEPPKTGGVGGWFQRAKAKLDAHLKEYGAIALVVYLTIWLTVWAGFAIAIAGGFSAVDGEGEAATDATAWGVILAAYIPTKLSQPLRIGATLLITPVVAGIWHRIRGKKPKGTGSKG